jgi:CubicO group peptidase (beta-lactamase class C family)
VFTGATGCVALGPDGADPKVGFAPLPPVTVRPDVAWPQGDAPPQGNWPAEVDKAALDHAVDLAFAPDAQTAAFLVLYHGRILAERYGAGINARTRLPGWSMTKTLQATLVGALEQDRRLKLFEPAPIAEWSGASDPRRLITLADLLRMSAPISCGRGLNQPKGWFDHAAWRRDGYPESLYVFSGPDDTYAYSINRPPLAPDELRGGYKNCQPHVVGHIVQQELRKTGETVAGYATAKVFAPLGIGSMVLEPDRVGNRKCVLQLCHRARLGPARAALCARRRLERATYALARIHGIRPRSGPMVDDTGLWRASVAEQGDVRSLAL